MNRGPGPVECFSIIALLVALLTTTLFSAPATAVTDGTAEKYRQAKKILASDPAAAFELARKLPTFSYADDLRLELLAKAAVRTGHPEVARETLDELRAATSHEDVRFWAGLALAELRLLGSEVDSAGDLVDELVDEADDLDVRAAERRFFRSRLVRLRHDLAKARGETDEAKKHALTLATEYPSTDAAPHPGLVELEPLDASQRFVRAKSLYDAWAYQRA
ncbi:MAG: hypothetical protein ABEN55_23890, partial [Bradymonadaceae bacterium]